MRFRVLLFVQILALFLSQATAQENIRDVVVLKNNNGTIKGFISEQVPGKEITIIPSEATLKIQFNELVGTPSVKKIKRDSVETETDVIRLKDGKTIEGDILEQSPGNWLRIYTDSLNTLNYAFDEIEMIGKELFKEVEKGNILKAYGLLDIVYLKNNQRIEGLIIEQKIGISVKIETPETRLIYPVQEIVKTGKTGFDKNVDLFSQSAFLDKITTKKGSEIIGIITEQVPGVSVQVKTKDSGLFTEKWVDIVKIGKLINEYRVKDNPDSIKAEPKEPEFIGDAYIITDKDSLINLEKQQYSTGSKSQNKILFDRAPDKSPVRIVSGEQVSMVVKAANNQVSPLEQIYVFKISQEKIRKRDYRYINTEEHVFFNKAARTDGKYLKFEYKKVGQYSFRISFQVESPGEYAIYVEGNPKSMSLFGIDPQKSEKNENNNHRKR